MAGNGRGIPRPFPAPATEHRRELVDGVRGHHERSVGIRAPASELGGVRCVRTVVRRIAALHFFDASILGGVGWHRDDHCRRRPLIFWTIVAAAAIGAALGDWLSYWIGYHYHAQIQQMWPLKNHPKLLDKGRVFFRRWGGWGIVIARFSGPLRASVPIVAGIAEMPWLRFQVANWSSAYLWAFVLLSPGSWGMKWWTQYFS
jgi:membrane protein YqaA with SNARE-associated domain